MNKTSYPANNFELKQVIENINANKWYFLPYDADLTVGEISHAVYDCLGPAATPEGATGAEIYIKAKNKTTCKVLNAAGDLVGDKLEVAQLNLFRTGKEGAVKYFYDGKFKTLDINSPAVKTWQEDLAYKAPIIVAVGGVYYVAFKDVPAETPISDTEFWGQIDASGSPAPDNDLRAVRVKTADGDVPLLNLIGQTENKLASEEFVEELLDAGNRMDEYVWKWYQNAAYADGLSLKLSDPDETKGYFYMCKYELQRINSDSNINKDVAKGSFCVYAGTGDLTDLYVESNPEIMTFKLGASVQVIKTVRGLEVQIGDLMNMDTGHWSLRFGAVRSTSATAGEVEAIKLVLMPEIISATSYIYINTLPEKYPTAVTFTGAHGLTGNNIYARAIRSYGTGSWSNIQNPYSIATLTGMDPSLVEFVSFEGFLKSDTTKEIVSVDAAGLTVSNDGNNIYFKNASSYMGWAISRQILFRWEET